MWKAHRTFCLRVSRPAQSARWPGQALAGPPRFPSWPCLLPAMGMGRQAAAHLCVLSFGVRRLGGLRERTPGGGGTLGTAPGAVTTRNPGMNDCHVWHSGLGPAGRFLFPPPSKCARNPTVPQKTLSSRPRKYAEAREVDLHPKCLGKPTALLHRKLMLSECFTTWG